MEARRLDQPARVADLRSVVHHNNDVPPAGYSGRNPRPRTNFPPDVRAERQEVKPMAVGWPPFDCFPEDHAAFPPLSVYRLSIATSYAPWAVGVALET